MLLQFESKMDWVLLEPHREIKAAALNILLELESKLIILLHTNNQGLYNKLHGSLKVLQQKFIV